MRELFELTEKYGCKAPLAAITENFELKPFMRLCHSLEVSETTLALANSLFVALQYREEKIASLDHLANAIGKTSHTIRHHLEKLKLKGLVESEFVTTDKIKRRRGVLFTLVIPKQIDVHSETIKRKAPDNFQLVPSNQIQNVSSSVMDMDVRIITLIVIRFLVKAMRTNRKDKRELLKVWVQSEDNERVRVTSEAESGRLMYVKDLQYYTGTLTWLYSHIESLVTSNQIVTETYTLPLDKLVSLCRSIPISDASSGGYTENAIQALRRISSTTFRMDDLPVELGELHYLKGVDLFFKLFRLEAVVTYEDNNKVKKAARLQFPKHTVDAIERAVREKNAVHQLLLIDDEVLSTNNEVEILFGLWARDKFNSMPSFSQSYTWNAFREIIAPGTTLTEFKRKFTALMMEYADPTYSPSVDEKAKPKITRVINNVHLTGKGESQSALYARATFHGFIINIGYDPKKSSPILFFRKDLSALLYTSRGRLLNQ